MSILRNKKITLQFIGGKFETERQVGVELADRDAAFWNAKLYIAHSKVYVPRVLYSNSRPAIILSSLLLPPCK